MTIQWYYKQSFQCNGFVIPSNLYIYGSISIIYIYHRKYTWHKYAKVFTVCNHPSFDNCYIQRETYVSNLQNSIEDHEAIQVVIQLNFWSGSFPKYMQVCSPSHYSRHVYRDAFTYFDKEDHSGSFAHVQSMQSCSAASKCECERQTKTILPFGKAFATV